MYITFGLSHLNRPLGEVLLYVRVGSSREDAALSAHWAHDAYRNDGEREAGVLQCVGYDDRRRAKTLRIGVSENDFPNTAIR